MLAFEPPRLIEFDWGGDVIRIELAPEGKGTRLTLFDTVSEYGKSARDAAGWHVCLVQLESHLSDKTASGMPWKPLFAEYGRRFGPESAGARAGLGAPRAPHVVHRPVPASRLRTSSSGPARGAA
jgi:hypothetical protein